MTDLVLARQTAAELAHWRDAIDGLADLDTAAAPQAWAGLEDYLQLGLRSRLTAVVADLAQQARALERSAAGRDPSTVRADLLALRQRYVQAETVLDFYCDAVNSRTNPAVNALLRGLDVLAGDSMAATLAPLGIAAPPALVYLDKGLGASILRAGIRLWDQAHPSPCAAIKLTRHNLLHPTAMLHETGHQVAHLSGWTVELGDALHAALAPRSIDVADAWRSWASEVAADVHAFVQSGWAPVHALANVVDGTTAQVFRIRFGDPHPFGWIRVMFNVALCRSWYGAGPWDDVAVAWWRRHPIAAAGPEAEHVARVSIAALDDIVAVCTRTPMRCFRGAPLSTVQDPLAAHPDRLRALAERAGASLLSSSYLRRRHSLQLFGWLTTRAVLEPGQAQQHHARLRAWLVDVGADATRTRTPLGTAA